MGSKKGTICKWPCMHKIRKENIYGCCFAMYTCVKIDATLSTIINNNKLLIVYFLNFP